MRLRKILLSGFKSFVDPLTIRLPSELTGIVGPNGCGKSNLVDAVRWVMGESSARQLRGELIADVIFNGSASRRPVGRASVELIFDNSGRQAGSRFADRGEISIRRVVDRDGHSVYFLNGTRCRRRDITDLFLGTGLGPRGYAIIEQGTVSRLIEARPEELRQFLEDAAGISLYRERRRETESRMHRTEENLARLGDLRDELDRQLVRLKRQAAQAERYTALKAEEHRLRSELSGLRWQGFAREAQAQEKALAEQQVRVDAAVAGQRAVEAELETFRESHRLAMDRHNERYRATLDVRTEVGRAEEAISQLRRQRDELRSSRERDRQVLAAADAESETDDSRHRELEARLREARVELESETRDAEEASRRLAGAERELTGLRAEGEDLRERFQAHAAEMQRSETALAHLRERREESAARARALEAERARLAAPADSERLGHEVERMQHALEAARGRLESRQRVITELRAKEAGQADAQHAARARLQSLTGRLASLEALQQAAMSRGGGEAGGWLEEAGLDGNERLPRAVEVAAEWTFAVECVLGRRLEAVRVDDAGRYASALARSERAGVVSLVSEFPGALAGPGGGARTLLIDHVRTGRALVAPWLAGVETAASAEEALARRSTLEPHGSIVTPDGIWVGPSWLQVFHEGDEEAGLLAREREIAGLRLALDGSRTDAGECDRRLVRTRTELEAAERERAECQAEWTERSGAYTRLRSEHAARVAAAEVWSRRLRDVGVERQTVDAARADAERAIAERERVLPDLLAASERFDAERGDFARRHDALQARVDSLRAAAERTRRSAHAAAVGVESMRVQARALEEARARSAARTDELRGRIAESEARLADTEAPIASAEAQLHRRLAEHREVEAEFAEARAAVEAREGEVKSSERERSARESEVARERARRDELRVAWNALIAKRDAAAEPLAEAGFDVRAVISDLPAGADPEVWQERLAALERRIERLGPINLAAVSELETQAERKRYLDEQHEDLASALETLKEAIRRIDRETRARFKETFEGVGRGLEERFPRLFGGGHAYLELTGADLLDTGVTVMARPPGKRNASIHLLSGGEKALTAIALVLALFDLNPAPFCLLDEVDAPLDDANVGRFVDLVRELSERVQIVLVTHNKTSMEAMHQLIGVTMHEAGVSRLVTVDVEDALEMAAV